MSLQALDRFYEAVMQAILRHVNFDGKMQTITLTHGVARLRDCRVCTVIIVLVRFVRPLYDVPSVILQEAQCTIFNRERTVGPVARATEAVSASYVIGHVTFCALKLCFEVVVLHRKRSTTGC